MPYDLDISPDGRLLSGSVSEVNGDQFLRVWELQKILAGDIKPLSEFRFGQSVPESFTFSKDGRYLYGSSYYTGVSNIFRYEVATGAVEAVSNAETGFFRPVPLADGRLVVLNYTGQGFTPAIIDSRPIADVSAITFLGAELAEKYPVVKTWQVPPPSTVDDEKIITQKGTVRSVAQYPSVECVSGDPRATRTLPRSDITSTSMIRCSLPALGSPRRTRRAQICRATNGDTSRSSDATSSGMPRCPGTDPTSMTCSDRRSAAARAMPQSSATTGSYINDEPRRLDLFLDAAYYDQIDTLPTAQNVSTNFTRLVTGEARLVYTDVKRSIGAVDDEKGVAWQLVYTGNRVKGEIAPQFRGALDFGFALPIGNSSVWLRSAAGVANGDRNNTVANFYFGSFGNNYVDDKSVKRYRQYDSFPGFGIDEISALSFVREMGEWNLPPVVFESAARRVSMSTGCARRSSLRAFGPTRATRRCARITRARRAGRSALQRPSLVRDDAVSRLRRRVSRVAARGQRVDDLAQDHVGFGSAARAETPCRSISCCTCSWASRRCCAFSPRCSISTATSSCRCAPS